MIIEDRTGAVLEQWTGFQVAWTMARGYTGAFGRHVGALYIWLPLCALFLLPFASFRRPLSLLNLDLLVLLSFSVSLAFFDHAHIYASVPLVYPPLLYLLARMLAMLRRRGQGSCAAAAQARDPDALARGRPRVPALVQGRAERDRRKRDRRRLRGRHRRAEGGRRRPAVRVVAVRQRTRRHVRPVQLRGLRPVRADLRLERQLGRPACGARRRRVLRPARRGTAVPDRPPHAGAHAGRRAGIRVGRLSLHAVHAGERLQRRAAGGAGARGGAGRHLPDADRHGRARACSRRSPGSPSSRPLRSRR